jgi:histidine decarboxylase
VLAFFADLFDRPSGDLPDGRPRRWGCITTGSTGAIRHGLRLGRDRLGTGVMVYTDAAHYSVPKAGHLLRMPAVRIGTDPSGEMNYAELDDLAAEMPGPMVVLATAGTAMTEAVDDVAAIRSVLAARPHYIHMDAALTGPTLAVHDQWRHLVAGDHPPDSISFSAHKFLGVPQPCGVLLADRGDAFFWQQHVPYIDADDTTDEGSRAGQLALYLWWTIHQLRGAPGIRRVSDQALDVAAYAADQIAAAGWGGHRHPWGLTVAFKQPSPEMCRAYGLAVSGTGWARWLAMPGRTRRDVDHFVHALSRESRTDQEGVPA